MSRKRVYGVAIVMLCLLSLFIASTSAKCLSDKKQLITLDFKSIPIRELLPFIAETMGYNLIMNESVTGNLTLHFREISWQQALDSILEMSGLVKKQNDKILFVGTPHEFALRQKTLSESSPYKTIKMKLNHADADTVKTILKNQTDLFSSNSKISLNPRENSLLIKDTAENLPYLVNFLHKLDQPEKQIYIAAKIINIDHKKIQELGISFKQTARTNSAQGVTVPEIGLNSIQFAIASMSQQQLLNLQLHALETTGHSKIMADPTLITLNRKPAIIEAGEEIPYQESTSSGATSVTFKKAALILKVTPTALPDGHILMDLEVHQNKISPIAVNGTPAIQTQELKTQVSIQDGQMVILGGIFDRSDAEVCNGLPILSKVPLVKTLISHKDEHFVRKELLIFVAPHILSS